MKITTRKPKMMAVSLTNDDLHAGSLDHISYVQADGIYALEKDLICDTIGIVRPDKMQEIRNLVSDLFSPDSG
jgi:mRNA-degrading endonuclease toxin of MazEF toxin-antitoxin module